MLVMLPEAQRDAVGQHREQPDDDHEGDVDAALPEVTGDQRSQVARPQVQARGGALAGDALGDGRSRAAGGLVLVIRPRSFSMVMRAMRLFLGRLARSGLHP